MSVRPLAPVATATDVHPDETDVSAELPRFPSTRYQGSKRRLLGALQRVFARLSFATALDLYSGSGVVSLLLRHLGKQVDANDFQLYNQATARLLLHATPGFLHGTDHEARLRAYLAGPEPPKLQLVTERYRGIFFTNEENSEIDRFCQRIGGKASLERDLYVHCVGQALLKKRPYNLFHRSNLNMRSRDVARSFGNAATWETPIIEHAARALVELRNFPFGDAARDSFVHGVNTSDLSKLPGHYDLVYLDPPYLNARGQGLDYSDCYGFLDGLCDYGLFAQGDISRAHRPIGRKESRWSREATALEELSEVCSKWSSSIVVLSYRSDGRPTPSEAAKALGIGGRRVEAVSLGACQYALSPNRETAELLFVSKPWPAA